MIACGLLDDAGQPPELALALDALGDVLSGPEHQHLTRSVDGATVTRRTCRISPPGPTPRYSLSLPAPSRTSSTCEWSRPRRRPGRSRYSDTVERADRLAGDPAKLIAPHHLLTTDVPLHEPTWATACESANIRSRSRSACSPSTGRCDAADESRGNRVVGKARVARCRTHRSPPQRRRMPQRCTLAFQRAPDARFELFSLLGRNRLVQRTADQVRRLDPPLRSSGPSSNRHDSSPSYIATSVPGRLASSNRCRSSASPSAAWRCSSRSAISLNASDNARSSGAPSGTRNVCSPAPSATQAAIARRTGATTTRATYTNKHSNPASSTKAAPARSNRKRAASPSSHSARAATAGPPLDQRVKTRAQTVDKHFPPPVERVELHAGHRPPPPQSRRGVAADICRYRATDPVNAPAGRPARRSAAEALRNPVGSRPSRPSTARETAGLRSGRSRAVPFRDRLRAARAVPTRSPRASHDRHDDRPPRARLTLTPTTPPRSRPRPCRQHPRAQADSTSHHATESSSRDIGTASAILTGTTKPICRTPLNPA